jgi:glycosyltransferase involved in cell wall biosynthesis
MNINSSTNLFSRKDDFLLSCIVPAFNEAAHIHSFLIALSDTLKALAPNYEIVLINDGSTDNTETIVRPLIDTLPIRYLSLSRNFGKEAALSAGIDHAKGDVVLMMDGDFQHPLKLIPDMLQLWQMGYDMAYGVIENRQQESILKILGTRFFYRLLKFDTSLQIPENAGDFRLMDRCVVNALKQLPERNRFMKGLYAWVGFKSVALPFTPLERASGQSTFRLSSLSKLAITGITAFTTLPLRIWSIIGACISAAALIYAAWVAVKTIIYGNDVPGWTTLTVGLLFFSGVQLFSIGVIGEYLGRVYEEVKNRPIYIIQQDSEKS